MSDTVTDQSSTRTVLILFIFLIVLIILLVFLYKKLNRDTHGEYTVRRMVYKEGGVRDRIRGAGLALGTRFGVQLWPQSDSNEGQVEEGDSEGSDSEVDDKEEDDNDDVEQCDKARGRGDTSDDNLGLSSEAEDQASVTDQAEAKGETEEKVGDGEGEDEDEARGGTGLLVDLKQFSGSAIWNEEEVGEGKNIDMTAL